MMIPSHQFNACDFASNHVPLILNHSTNKGASAARNTGLLHTSGDIICFLDDDDLWLPTYLESQVESLSNTSPHIGFSYSHSLVLNSKNSISNRLRPTISGNIFDLQLISHRITNISCVAIKSTVLDLVPMFDVDLPRGNDSDFIRQLSYYFHCVCVPKLLVLYNFDENLPRITSYSSIGLSKAIYSLTFRIKKYFTSFSVRPMHLSLVIRQLSFLYFRIGDFKRFIFCLVFLCCHISCLNLPLSLIKSNLMNLSVVVTTHNRSHLLPGCLESILNNDLSSNNILVVDDSDLYPHQFINQLTCLSYNIPYKFIPNSGLASSRNYAFSRFTTEFVTFLDDDDRWPANYLASISAYLTSSTTILLSFSRVLLECIPFSQFPQGFQLQDLFYCGITPPVGLQIYNKKS